MDNTLSNNEHMWVGKLGYRISGGPARGDVVVCHYNGHTENYVKRVVALGGDTVAIEEGTLRVNGVPVPESYIKEPMVRDFDEVTVPHGYVFVMGDNRNASLDSRSEGVGPIPLDQIVGKVLVVLWPLGGLRAIS